MPASTTPLHRADTEDELTELLADAFPARIEDQGIGPYEYGGRCGHDSRPAAVVEGGCLDVDVTGWEGPAEDLPDELRPQPRIPDEHVDVQADWVVAKLVGVRFQKPRIIATYEVSEL